MYIQNNKGNGSRKALATRTGQAAFEAAQRLAPLVAQRHRTPNSDKGFKKQGEVRFIKKKGVN